jgi:hypothetical protein
MSLVLLWFFGSALVLLPSRLTHAAGRRNRKIKLGRKL